MADKVVLLDYCLSPHGMALRIALDLKGVDYEIKEEEIINRSPLLLQLNPVHKKVPVLIHKGRPVCDSVVALHYIDEVWNDRSPLLPLDPYLRSQARFWVDFVNKKFSGFANKLCAAKEEEHEAVKMNLFDSLKVVEGELGDKPFFGDETIGLVDLALLPFVIIFSVFEKLGILRLEAECRKITSWLERCFKIESVSDSVPGPDLIHAYGCVRFGDALLEKTWLMFVSEN